MEKSPYDPPNAPLDPGAGDPTLAERIAQGRARAKWLVWLLALGMFLDACAVLSGLAQYSLLGRAASGVAIGESEASANDLRHSTISALGLVVLLATAVVWLFWMYRAYSNLGLMGTKRTNYRPGWAVGYWFVPLLNLFRPYQITRELWQRSDDRNASEVERDTGTPALLAGWWLVWIVSNILGQIVGRASFGAEELEELISLTRWGIVDDGVGILSAGLALTVVRSIDRLQGLAAAEVS